MKHVALQSGEYRRYAQGAGYIPEAESSSRRGEEDGAWTIDDRIGPLRTNPRRLPPGMY